ncbi:MAG: M56 family metallopeptidase [Planctomycetota bacterium]
MSTALDPALMAAASWCATYLVHSTCAIGIAALVSATLRRDARARELAWKSALCLPLVTTSLHVTWPERAFAPRYSVAIPARIESPAGPLVGPITARLAEAPESAQPREPRASRALGAEHVSGPSRVGGVARASGAGPAARSPRPADAAPTAALTTTGASGSTAPNAPRDGDGRLALLGAAGALIAAAALLVPRARLAWLLRKREPLLDGVLAAELAALAPLAARGRALGRVRLSTCDVLESPIAIGVLRPEIVVPTRALSELSRPLARALIAHELAHHARRDPLWAAFAHALTTLLALQPLNRVARRELVAVSELLADDLALEWTDDGLGLARCLAEVAGWMTSANRHHVAPTSAAIAMVRAAHADGLAARVERALLRRRGGHGRLLTPLALALGTALGAAAPGLAFVAAEAAAPAAADAALGPAPAPLEALDAAARELTRLERELDACARATDPNVRARARALTQRATALRHVAAELRARLSQSIPVGADTLHPILGGTKIR